MRRRPRARPASLENDKADAPGVPIIVVGAGAAGFLAAIFARVSGRPVILLDGTDNPGQKILISGGGRCNVLPARFEPERFISESPRIARNILRSWRLDEIRIFFEERLGIPLALEEASNKFFPVSNRASDVRDALTREISACGAVLRTRARVVDVCTDPLGVRLESGEIMASSRIILATGGLSIPKSGSDGIGLGIARRLGHAIVEPFPALTPLRTEEPRHRALAGVSRVVSLTVEAKRKRLAVVRGGFLFTHFGYSGPAVLDVSHFVTRGEPSAFTVCWTEESETQLDAALRRAPGSALAAGLLERRVPDRLAALLMECADVDSRTRIAQLTRGQRRRIVGALTRFRLPVSGHEGYARAEVTGGGVALTEIDPVTMESRRVPRLHFCGEILDAFGPIGGHNFLWAWVTGRAAGLAAGGAPL